MAYFVITEVSTGKYLGTSNDSHAPWVYQTFDSVDIAYISSNTLDNSAVIVFKDNRPPWEIDFSGETGCFKIETIKGVVPVGLEDLVIKLTMLKII